MIGLVSGCSVNVCLDPLFINPYLRGKTLVALRLRLFTPKTFLYGLASAQAADVMPLGITIPIMVPFLRKPQPLEAAERCTHGI